MMHTSESVTNGNKPRSNSPDLRRGSRAAAPLWPPTMRIVGFFQVLDELPAAVTQQPGRVWNVFARSLGEQGARGRTALAWRWALTGLCPSPVTLSPRPGRPPDRGQLLYEGKAEAQLTGDGTDPGGQVLHARFVLQWLAGELSALPLWNGPQTGLPVSGSAEYGQTRSAMARVCTWAQLSAMRCPVSAENADDVGLRLSGWALGTVQTLGWVCGEIPYGPLSGTHVCVKPSRYEAAVGVRRAMTGALRARADGQLAEAARLEAVMESFLWLAGWSPVPPVDRHGHSIEETCADREADCQCDAVGRCMREECPACQRFPCVHGFGQEGFEP